MPALISCHQCRGSLTVPHGAPAVTCPHCGAVNMVPAPQSSHVPPATWSRDEFNEVGKALRGLPKWVLVVGALVLIGMCRAAIDGGSGAGEVHTATSPSVHPESDPKPARAAGLVREHDVVEPEPYAVEESKPYHGDGTIYFFAYERAPPLTIRDGTDAWPAAEINEALKTVELAPVSAEIAAAQVGWGRGFPVRTFPGYPGGELRVERRTCSGRYDCVWKITFRGCEQTDEQGECPDESTLVGSPTGCEEPWGITQCSTAQRC